MKPFSELIKNFNKIRDYMRDFYVFGFKSREDFDQKSLRSYDNERRRIESYLAGYMSFAQNESGKNIFISVDSSDIEQNPFYRAFKAKSFTKNDISMHFIIFDILTEHDALTTEELLEKLAGEYYAHFGAAEAPEVSTLRKKLAEYVQIGLLEAQKDGRKTVYSLARDSVRLDGLEDTIQFFSEVSPLGVVGSYLLDKLEYKNWFIRFKHHYVMYALESDVLHTLLQAIGEKRAVQVISLSRKHGKEAQLTLVPFYVLVGAQSGRRYVAAYDMRVGKFNNYRLDYIRDAKLLDVQENYDGRKAACQKVLKTYWGAAISRKGNVDHLEMHVRILDDEQHIVSRMQHEGRNGMLEQISPNEYIFKVETTDLSEMVPFLRTFIGKIVSIKSTDPEFDRKFMRDIEDMYTLYEISTN